jgi:hypothetical protein
MTPYRVTRYSEAELRKALVKGSHAANDAVLGKEHLNYLHGYLQKIAARTIVIEDGYVDRDFLEDFASYHVRCFTNYKSNCIRLHFFNKPFKKVDFDGVLLRRKDKTAVLGVYLGFIVVKPLPYTVVGRTCLATYPQFSLVHERVFPTLREERANLFGIDLTLKSLPFQEQDRDVAACASSALWSVLNGTSRLFQHATPSPVEITKAAGVHIRTENRQFPAGGGLSPDQIADAIRSVGLEPHAIGAVDMDLIKIEALAYLRAGIPCMLLGDLHRIKQDGSQPFEGGHAIAVTGYGKPTTTSAVPSPITGCRLKALAIDRFYCHDDQVGPFAKLWVRNEGLFRERIGSDGGFILKPTVLLVPLYHKIRISVLDILDLTQDMDTFIEALRLAGHLRLRERITWDIRLSTIGDLRGDLAVSPLDDINKMRLLTRDYPRFLWRIEASVDRTMLFEAIADATDLLQGEHLIDIVPHDRVLCHSIGAALPLIHSWLPQRPRAGRFLRWFSDNVRYLQ